MRSGGAYFACDGCHLLVEGLERFELCALAEAERALAISLADVARGKLELARSVIKAGVGK